MDMQDERNGWNLKEILENFVPQSATEFAEASRSFGWYAPTFLKISDKESHTVHSFWLNSAQRKLLNIINSTRNNYGGGQWLILKSRQMGTSTFCSGFFSHQIFTKANMNFMHIAHQRKAVANFLSMDKLFLNKLPGGIIELPDGAKIGIKPRQVRSNSNELIVAHDSEGTELSRLIVSSADEDAGRSFALSGLHYSEIGSSEFADGRVVNASLQTLSKDGIVFGEGTPNGCSGWFYESWLDEQNGWGKIFLPWYEMIEWNTKLNDWQGYTIPLDKDEVIEPTSEWEAKLLDGRICENGKGVMPSQLKWVRWMKLNRISSADLALSPDDAFNQEYPTNQSDCWVRQGSAYFSADTVQKGLEFARERERTHPEKRYRYVGGELVLDRFGPWHFVEEPDPSATYSMGGDAAQGLENGDYDTAVLWKRMWAGPDKVVGYYRDREPDKYSQALQMACVGYKYNKALIAMENKDQGVTVNRHLEDLNYPRLFIQDTRDDGSFRAKIKPRYGFMTGGKSKSIICGDLQEGLGKWAANPDDNDGLEIPFKAIWQEISAFSLVERRLEAMKGSHDDLVMATAIGAHARESIGVGYAGKPRGKDAPPNTLTLGDMIRRAGKKQYRDWKKLTGAA